MLDKKEIIILGSSEQIFERKFGDEGITESVLENLLQEASANESITASDRIKVTYGKRRMKGDNPEYYETSGSVTLKQLKRIYRELNSEDFTPKTFSEMEKYYKKSYRKGFR